MQNKHIGLLYVIWTVVTNSISNTFMWNNGEDSCYMYDFLSNILHPSLEFYKKNLFYIMCFYYKSLKSL